MMCLSLIVIFVYLIVEFVQPVLHNELVILSKMNIQTVGIFAPMQQCF